MQHFFSFGIILLKQHWLVDELYGLPEQQESAAADREDD